MSKRHRKSKNFLNSQSGEEDIAADRMDLDPDMLEAPKGKKPRGKHRREAHKQKRAYYDD